jgi:hypothetical protein
VSLTSPVPDGQGVAHTSLGKDCFYCGRRLSDPSVFWMGHTGEVYLHPPCVFPLFVRLCRDMHELDAPEYYRRARGER